MGAQLRVYRQRIRTVQSTKKITKAMELIATSRIAKAQTRVRAAKPYADELTRALAALGGNNSLKHPMLTGSEHPARAGILLVTSDRGLAGGYSANAIKKANELAEELRAEGKEPVRYVIGRKGLGYFRFRNIHLAGSWTGFSEQPDFLSAREATDAVIAALLETSEGEVNGEAGIDELYIVFTKFESMIAQTPTVEKVSPVKTDEVSVEPTDADAADAGPQSAYDFEPEPTQLLAALLPKYVTTRIFAALLDSAASESAARRRAMKSASDNAEELSKTYRRLANQARQAEITQEISEIVGGADALASAGSDKR